MWSSLGFNHTIGFNHVNQANKRQQQTKSLLNLTYVLWVGVQLNRFYRLNVVNQIIFCSHYWQANHQIIGVKICYQQVANSYLYNSGYIFVGYDLL